MIRETLGLMRAGTTCLSSLARGQDRLAQSPRQFARGLLDAMRPHFFALPGGAALAGAAVVGPTASCWRAVMAAILAGLGWGVGQLLNDFLDRDADAVDAPDRPAVSGALPEGPTMLIAMLLGIGIAVGIVCLHPAAGWLALSAGLLLVGYGFAKRLPIAGNLAHGALLGTATFIGAAGTAPCLPLRVVLTRASLTALIVGGWAMVYLESNYEKDRRGDGAAGYLTLPQVVGLRASAALRLAGAPGLALWAHHSGLLPGTLADGMMSLAAALIALSSLVVLRKATDQAALDGYRPSVHGAALGVLALGSPVLGNIATLCVTALNGVLIEMAFRRRRNP